MFTKNITISALVITVFAVVAIALPVVFSNDMQFETATVAAWGSGGTSDGGSGGGSGGDGCGGCGGDDSDPDPEPNPNPPVCRYLKANGQSDTLTLPYGGGSVDLTWDSLRATGATLTPNGSPVAVNGSKTVNVTSDATYTLRVTNSDGSDTCRVNIDVQDAPAASCDLFTATPDAFYNGTGGQVTLTWETTNAQSVSIAGVGNFADADGSTTVNFGVSDATSPVSHTYTLTALGVGNNDTCTDTITVYPPEDRQLTCQDVAFTTNPNSPVVPGTSVNLSWVFTGDVSAATIDNGIGDAFARDNVDVVINDTTTFNATIANAVSQKVCPVTIQVEDEPDTITCGNNVTFTASDYNLPKGGGDVTLAWTTTDIDSISINGVASTDLNGSEVVNVTSDRTYTLSATADGKTISCPLSIDVKTGGGGSSSPRCSLKISDDKIKAGEEVTLSWNTSKTEEVRIEDNHGNVLIDTDDNDELDGEMKIRPTKDTEYTLNAKRGTRERTCEVEVEVEESVVVYESRSQEPRVAGISLTQVPYTGFEAGPALTTIFYAILTLWGLFVAYVVVIRRDRVAGVSLAGAHDHVDFTDQSVEAANTQESSVAEGYVYEATTTPPAPANLPTAQPFEPIVGYDQYVEKKTMEK